LGFFSLNKLLSLGSIDGFLIGLLSVSIPISTFVVRVNKQIPKKGG